MSEPLAPTEKPSPRASARDPTTSASPVDLEWLSEFITRQEGHIVDELATGLVGIGALFFAYASLPASPYQPLIALVGVGGSLVLFLHGIVAYRDRESAYALWRSLSKGTKNARGKRTTETWEEIGQWRYEGLARRFFVPFPAAVTALFFWVVVIWMYILVAGEASLGWSNAIYVGLSAALFLASYGILHQITYVRSLGYRARHPPRPPPGP